jgi:hypothetical protein
VTRNGTKKRGQDSSYQISQKVSIIIITIGLHQTRNAQDEIARKPDNP